MSSCRFHIRWNTNVNTSALLNYYNFESLMATKRIIHIHDIAHIIKITWPRVVPSKNVYTKLRSLQLPGLVYIIVNYSYETSRCVRYSRFYEVEVKWMTCSVSFAISVVGVLPNDCMSVKFTFSDGNSHSIMWVNEKKQSRLSSFYHIEEL